VSRGYAGACLGVMLALTLSAAPAGGDVVGCPSGAQEGACENDNYDDGTLLCCSTDGKCASGFDLLAGEQKCGNRVSGPGAGTYKSTCCMAAATTTRRITTKTTPAPTTTTPAPTTPAPGPLSCAAGAYENHEKNCVPCDRGKFHPHRITDCAFTPAPSPVAGFPVKIRRERPC